MNEVNGQQNGNRTVSSEEITNAMRRAVRDAVLTHAKLGRSVPISRDGKVVWITPEEIFAMFPEQVEGSD